MSRKEIVNDQAREKMHEWLEGLITHGLMPELTDKVREEVIGILSHFPVAGWSKGTFCLGAVALFSELSVEKGINLEKGEAGAINDAIVEYLLGFPEADKSLMEIAPLGVLTLTPVVIERATGEYDEDVIRRWETMGILKRLSSFPDNDPERVPPGPYWQLDSQVKEVVLEANRYLDPNGIGERRILNKVVYGSN